ncbi:hypothetical protein [Streptomyces sp. NPDC058240]|uniref:hypothetical protein n=1 Tax=Streptomyces sp. NPDC058240 TaxID=3346396 RepID=UPI0036EB6560
MQFRIPFPARCHAYLKSAVAAAAVFGAVVLPAAPAQADMRTAASWQCDGGRVNVPSNPDFYTAW